MQSAPLRGISLLQNHTAWTNGKPLFRLDIGVHMKVDEALAGFIGTDQLNQLCTGIRYCVAEAILRLYQRFTNFENLEIPPILQEVAERSAQEILSPDEHDLMSIFKTLATWSATEVIIRLDEKGRSICTGQNVVGLTFISLEIVSKTHTRVWLLDGEAVLFIAFFGEEIDTVWERICFGNQQSWNGGVGAEKEITCTGHRRKMENEKSYFIRDTKACQHDLAARAFVLGEVK